MGTTSFTTVPSNNYQTPHSGAGQGKHQAAALFRQDTTQENNPQSRRLWQRNVKHLRTAANVSDSRTCLPLSSAATSAVVAEINLPVMAKILKKANGRPSTFIFMIKWSHSLKEHYYSVTSSNRSGLVPPYTINIC